jgi:RimJ/RimL family protein N-acetyltransferase
MIKFLQGENVCLRGITQSDANDLYLSWLNDREITAGLVVGKFPTELHELERYIASSISNPDSVLLAIIANDSNTHIGNIKLGGFDWIARNCELGLLIGDRNYWGKGIGKEVCELTLDYAFNTLNMHRVWLTVFTNNPSAQRLYEKLGFVVEGAQKEHVFVNGSYYNKVYMGLLKEDFNR